MYNNFAIMYYLLIDIGLKFQYFLFHLISIVMTVNGEGCVSPRKLFILDLISIVMTLNGEGCVSQRKLFISD